MKRLNLIVIALFFAVGLSSQPIISNEVWIDLGEGESLQLLNIDASSFNPGPAGANVEWDQRGLPLDEDVCFFEAFDVSLSPRRDSFPNADHFYICATSNDEGFVTETSIFYSHKNNRVSFEGTFTRSVSDPDFDSLFTVYTDPHTMLVFPIEYQDSYSDDYSLRITTYTDNVLIARIDGSVTTTADAYGTLRTDAGNFNNALRLKTTDIIEISVPGSPYTVINEKYRYSWLSPSENYFLLSIDSTVTLDLSGNPIPSITQYEGLARLGEPSSVSYADNNLDVSVYPNPATDRIFVSSSGEIDHNSYYVIRDISGRQLDKGVLSGSGNKEDVNFSIDIGHLPTGTFFLQIYNEGNRLGKTIPVFKGE